MIIRVCDILSRGSRKLATQGVCVASLYKFKCVYLLLLMLRWMQPMELCRLGELQGEESTIQIWILMDKLTVDDKDQTWNALSKLRQRGWFGACWCCLSRKAMQCPALLLHRITIMQRCFSACGRDGSVHGPSRSAMWRAMRWCMQFGCHFQEHKGHTLYFSRASSP